MKKIIFGIVLIGLVSAGAWAVIHEPAPAEPVPEVTDKTYADPAERFAIHYPAHWTALGPEAASTTPNGWSVVTQAKGMVVAKISAPQDLYPGTNFSEAWLTAGWSNDPVAIKNCLVNAQQEGMDVQDATLAGQPAKKFTTGDAAAGNYYETTAYHAILNGDCWAIEYTIHSTNIYNYPPEAGITEFDKAGLTTVLDEVAHGFRFLVNSD